MPDRAPDAGVRVEVACPQQWSPFASKLATLVEKSCLIGASYQLPVPRLITLTIEYAPLVQMEADWRSDRIDVSLPFAPVVSAWIFSIYFGVAHEVGHLLWHNGPLTLREAWASYFALAMLEARSTRRLLPNRTDRILLAKDYWSSMGILTFQRFWGNAVECATARIIQIWRRAGSNQVATFLNSAESSVITRKLTWVKLFSEHFSISEDIAMNWLHED